MSAQKAGKLDIKEKELIYKQKFRCTVCYEIPIISDLVNPDGTTYFFNSECLHKHGNFFRDLKSYINEKYQIDNIKCHFCNKFQGTVDIKTNFFRFCQDCVKFICPACLNSHYRSFQNNHHLINLYEFDFLCREHNSPYTGFCKKCAINICNTCKQRTHLKHENKILYSDIMPDKQKIKDISTKLEEQKGQLDEINKVLDKLIKHANKAKEYQDNLNSILKFNYQIYNSLNVDKPNYQSIVNFDKIIDMDITDISWVTEIQSELDNFIKLIKSQSANLHKEKNQTSSNNIDKEILETYKKSIIGDVKKTSLDLIETQFKEEDEDFTDNELLKEIGKRNKRIFKKEQIVGELKNIYNMNDCNNYLMNYDNGIFIYDKDSNDLISYIDINNSLEYDEINAITHYYNSNTNKIYLFLGTNTNKIKIYSIDENNQFAYELIQEIKLEQIINIFCNKNGDLFVLEKESFSTYKFKDNMYLQEKEYINEENETKNLYSTENYLICTIKEKEKLLFYDRNTFDLSFSIDNISNDEKTKIFELSKNLICVSFKNKIQVIDVGKKSPFYTYEKPNMDYIESGDLINEKMIFLSINLDNKLVFMILEWDDSNKKFNEKKTIEDLQCKLICKAKENRVILYTKYGLNMIRI